MNPLLENAHLITQKDSVTRQFVAVVISCIGPLIFGFCLGYSSPTLSQLDEILNTSEKQSWFGSLVTVGAILGGPIAGFLVEKIGRKTTIMMCCIPFSMGYFIILFGQYYQLLYVGRILCGIGTGMTSLCVPLYIGEIATKNLRGTLGAGFQLSVTVGVVLAYALGIALSWRWLAVVGIALSVMLALLMLVVPETPHYLLGCGETDKAYDSLRWLRGPNSNIEQECQDISSTFGDHQGKMSLQELACRGSYYNIQNYLYLRMLL